MCYSVISLVLVRIELADQDGESYLGLTTEQQISLCREVLERYTPEYEDKYLPDARCYFLVFFPWFYDLWLRVLLSFLVICFSLDLNPLSFFRLSWDECPLAWINGKLSANKISWNMVGTANNVIDSNERDEKRFATASVVISGAGGVRVGVIYAGISFFNSSC
jgi:hypothetical protein